MKYTDFSEKFVDAHESEVFEMTGCLTNCDLFKYSIEQYGNIVAHEREQDYRYPIMLNNTLRLELFFKSADYELREQVRCSAEM